MKQTYDYIIIGSGPAGSTLAKTLTDSGEYSALLLEAGQNSDADELIQSANSNLYDHFPEYFWPGQSTPQKNARNRPFNLTGGRVAGGGSSVNGEMYVRPTPYVLRQWEKAGGAQWSPQNATKHFREIERYNGESDNMDARGTQGPLDIREGFPKPPALARKLAGAIEKASGCSVVQDYNNPNTPVGPFYSWQLYQKPDGSRASASRSFLSADVASPDGKGQGGRKLTVCYQATAVRILFNDAKEAQEVVYIRNGREETAAAAERVIVSAGINSVKLLMLSGIGPEEVLEEAGISAVYTNPNVGQGLMGDAYVSAVFEISSEDSEELSKADPNGKFAGGAFLPAPQEGAPGEERSIQMIPTQVFGQTLYMSVLCVNPKSRGSLRIQNADPFKIMLGDFGFLSNPQDVKTLMAALRNYIAPMGKALSDEDPQYRLVAPSQEVLDDDGKLADYIRSSFIHTYHDQCELKMGSEKDGGVVDGFGEVHGVKKLTVADASIIPYHMDGNTSASAYLIGHVIAKHLLGEE